MHEKEEAASIQQTGASFVARLHNLHILHISREIQNIDPICEFPVCNVGLYFTKIILYIIIYIYISYTGHKAVFS